MLNSYLENSKILIVDDQQPNIDLLVEFLKMHRFKNIQCTTDPSLTTSLFESFSPDLILLDLLMPKLSGFDVMDKLRLLISKDDYLPILILTADNTLNTKQLALAVGAEDFLSKPFDFIEVFLRIRNLLETRYLFQIMREKNQILEKSVEMIEKIIKWHNK